MKQSKLTHKTLVKEQKIKKVVFRLDSDLIYKVKRIALEKRTTQNNLFVEAIHMIVDKYKEHLK